MTGEALAVAPAIRAGSRRALLLGALGVLLVLVSFLSLGIGAVSIAPAQALAILAKNLGVSLSVSFDHSQEAVLTAIRLPRVLLGVLVGASLGVSGAAMQGLFRNPLADPALLGVSSGAALAAVSMIVLGGALAGNLIALLGPFAVPPLAFFGGLAATLLVQRVSAVAGRTVVETMLLAGIAINSLTGAATGLLTYVATDPQLRSITFWSLGSLGGATWASVLGAAPFLVLAITLTPRLATALNALSLGEAAAHHLGVPVERLKTQAVVLVALGVGAAVAVTGVIGFVGLVVPHLVRLVAGPDHRVVVPASALLGSSLLLLADLVARTIAAPAELPIGTVTAGIGAPFFLWLLVRHRRAERLF